MPQNKRYQMVLERLPIPGLILMFTIYCIMVLSTFIGAIIWAPDYFTSYSELISIPKHNFPFVCNGTDPIHFQYRNGRPHLNYLNMEVLFYITLSLDGFELIDSLTAFSHQLEMNMHLFGTNNHDALFTNDTIIGSANYATIHTRTLHCERNGGCKTIILFKEATVEHNYYQMEIYFKNLEPLCEKKIIDSRNIELGYVYINSAYNIVDIVFRLFATACTAFVAVAFVLITFAKQSWTTTTTEQKWLFVILFFLALYNNPSSLLQFISPKFAFPLVDEAMRLSYIFVLLLSILIFIHSSFTKPNDRNINFYVPKVLLVGSMWCLTLSVSVYSSLNRLNDPAYSFSNESQLYTYVRIAAFVLIILYMFVLLYYIIRAMTSTSARSRSSTKFRVVFGMTFCVIFFPTIVFIILRVQGVLVSLSSVYITFHVVFNLYPYLLAILFAPSSKSETLMISSVTEEEADNEPFIAE